MNNLYTIGHSTDPADVFVEKLVQHGITAICDVRSSPFSRYNPQFNREVIRTTLRDVGIEYVFLGKELGARPSNDECYSSEGRVQYHQLAKTSLFRQGLDRVRSGGRDYRIALACAEKDPIDCHRSILVCRALRSASLEIKHILADGSIETHSQLERRLLRMTKLPAGDLFSDAQAMIERAYDLKGRQIAWIRPDNEEVGIPEEEGATKLS